MDNEEYALVIWTKKGKYGFLRFMTANEMKKFCNFYQKDSNVDNWKLEKEGAQLSFDLYIVPDVPKPKGVRIQ